MFRGSAGLPTLDLVWRLRTGGMALTAGSLSGAGRQAAPASATGPEGGHTAPASGGGSSRPVQNSQSAPEGQTEAELREVAREFEAIFLEMLLKQVRKGTEALSGSSGGLDRQIYGGWFDQKVAEQVASKGGTGLGERLYQQLAQRYRPR